MATITDLLIRRCEERGVCAATTRAAVAIGLAIDAGVFTLDRVLDLVQRCKTPDELGDLFVMLAASIEVGCPAGHELRVFRVVGEPEGRQP